MSSYSYQILCVIVLSNTKYAYCLVEFKDKRVKRGGARCGAVLDVTSDAQFISKTISATRCVIEYSLLFCATKSMERTRNSWKCPLFGDLYDLKDNILPTYEDLLKFYEWTRHRLKFERETKKEPTYKEIEGVVVAKLIEIWAKSSIPTVEPKRMKVMLQTYHLKCKNLLKSHPKIPKNKLKEFRLESKVLFDISACKCRDFLTCTCPKTKKIPVREQSFVTDQRTTRQMMIGGIDVGTTKQITKALKRKLLREKSESKRIKVAETCTEKLNSTSESECVQSDCEEQSQMQLRTSNIKMESNTSIAVDYTLLSKTCDRFRVSDRAGAAIASAVLHASCSQVIDKSKLRRERKRTRDKIVLRQTISQIPALYFDGRKDQTLTMCEKNGKKYRRRILEEHISLIKEPDSEFLGYITPASGTAKCIEQEIFNFLLNSESLIDNFIAIGCDGTNVNVGKYGGIIRMLEKRLNRPLQWIICLLHMNELPFRHLFEYIDGSTSGPQTFAGTIGKELENCEKRPITQFQLISTNMPELSAKDISTDQKYLYKIVVAISTGIFPSDLENKSPGKMSHARWLTRANRILRLYVSVDAPSVNLITLATYIVKVYAPIWFSIKTHSSCKDGSRHLFKLIELTRYLPTTLKAVIDPVIQRNSYFAHPENLLLAMITDPQPQIRELAARRILKARSVTSKKLRLFQLPKLNFNASKYYDLLYWQDNITEPPLLKSVPEAKLRLFIDQKGDGELDLLRLPCHTQAVERAVKAVTEASATLCDKTSREGFIKAQIDSRKAMPKFDSKKDFATN